LPEASGDNLPQVWSLQQVEQFTIIYHNSLGKEPTFLGRREKAILKPIDTPGDLC
jgi:hypothetical protein